MSKKTHSQLLRKRQENPKAWSNKKKVIILYTTLMVFYGFYTMILGIIAFAEFSGVIDSYERIVDNLDNDIIVDIQPGQTGSCASDYNSLFKNEWPGTKPGCNCIDAPNTASYDDVSNQLYAGQCSGNQTSAGCTGVNQVLPKDFDLWEVNDVPQNVCIKRLKNSAFYKNAPSKPSCESDEEQCGQENEKNSIFCVKKGEKCPIYEFVFDTKQNTQKTSQGYEEIQLQGSSASSAKSLYINRNGKTQPISEIRMTEGEGVCKDNKIPNLSKGRTNYILNQQEKKYCKTPDKRFEIMTNGLSMGEVDYFTINGKYSEIQNLPLNGYSNTFKYNSYTRTFIQWNVDFREELKQIVELKDDIDNMSTSQAFIMSINVLVCLVVSIILTISQVYNLCGKDVPCIAGDGEKEQTRIKNIKKVCQYGAKILQLPFMLWAFWASANNKGFLRGVADEKPSDDITNKEFDDLASQIESQVYFNNLQMLISFILVCLVDLAMYGWKLRKRAQKKKNNKVGTEGEPYQKQIENSEDVEKEVPISGGSRKRINGPPDDSQQNFTPYQPQDPQPSYPPQQQMQSPSQQLPNQPPPMPMDQGQLPPNPQGGYDSQQQQQSRVVQPPPGPNMVQQPPEGTVEDIEQPPQ